MLRNYLYIDERRVDLLTQQIRTETKRLAKRTKKVSLSLTGPAVELADEEIWRELSVHEKIEALLDYLKRQQLVDLARPQELSPGRREEGRPFVFETMLARKIIIPEPHLSATPGIKHLAVWVSDPDPAVYSNEQWTWRGTFLYLTELWLDDGSYGTVYSGCSALQAIANSVAGRQLTARGAMEPLGRGNCNHPVEKLSSLGTVIGDQRRITAFYKKRYFTDEQCYLWQNEQRRVNDLLGYPIFISDAGS